MDTSTGWIKASTDRLTVNLHLKLLHLFFALIKRGLLEDIGGELEYIMIIIVHFNFYFTFYELLVLEHYIEDPFSDVHFRLPHAVLVTSLWIQIIAFNPKHTRVTIGPDNDSKENCLLTLLTESVTECDLILPLKLHNNMTLIPHFY